MPERIKTMNHYASEFEPIARKVIRDYHDKQNVEVVTAKSLLDNSVGITILFSNAGIFRSRPALHSVVEAAVNAIWNTTYHDLFGAEASEAIPLSIFEDEEL